MKRRILLVDDDVGVLFTLRAVLELRGFEVETAGSGAEALERMASGVYQMVITDMRIGADGAGLVVIRAARRQPYDPAVALLTAYPPAEPAPGEKPVEGGNWTVENSDSVLIKPLGTEELLSRLEIVLARHAEKQLTARNRATAETLNRTQHSG
jgi:DNA-binding response OmpR family regulator